MKKNPLTRAQLESTVDIQRSQIRTHVDEIAGLKRDNDALKERLAFANRIITLFEKLTEAITELAKRGKLPSWIAAITPLVAVAGVAALALTRSA